MSDVLRATKLKVFSTRFELLFLTLRKFCFTSIFLRSCNATHTFQKGNEFYGKVKIVLPKLFTPSVMCVGKPREICPATHSGILKGDAFQEMTSMGSGHVRETVVVRSPDSIASQTVLSRLELCREE